MPIRIKIKKSTLNLLKWLVPAAVVVIIALIIFIPRIVSSSEQRQAERLTRAERRAERQEEQRIAEEPKVPKVLYGIEYEDRYRLENGVVGSGQTLSHILGRLGVTSATIDKIDRTAKPVYNMRGMRAGQPYTAFMKEGTPDSLQYFVYEKNMTDYVVVSLLGDSVSVYQESKEVTINRRKEGAVIKSSLWNAMAEDNMPAALSVMLEDIFGWSVDFFGLQPGDSINVIFDEKYIDTLRVGVGRIWGAEFRHAGKVYYAIPFRQDGHITYWDENGNSLKKQFLKAPLKYSRISSSFSNSRMHPILKIRRPHHGVDYAAPSGTPVVAIADGTVTHKYWDSKGGGNVLKIKHSNSYVSGYLHLKGYASGINVGTRVSQGQLIAYVGSTGRSTGPHLDFRIWKSGTAIDPVKLPSGSVEPISTANREAFGQVRDKIMSELKGEIPEEEIVTEL